MESEKSIEGGHVDDDNEKIQMQVDCDYPEGLSTE